MSQLLERHKQGVLGDRDEVLVWYCCKHVLNFRGNCKNFVPSATELIDLMAHLSPHIPVEPAGEQICLLPRKPEPLSPETKEKWRNAFGTYAERPTKTVCYGDCEAPLWDLSSPVKYPTPPKNRNNHGGRNRESLVRNQSNMSSHSNMSQQQHRAMHRSYSGASAANMQFMSGGSATSSFDFGSAPATPNWQVPDVQWGVSTPMQQPMMQMQGTPYNQQGNMNPMGGNMGPVMFMQNGGMMGSPGGNMMGSPAGNQQPMQQQMPMQGQQMYTPDWGNAQQMGNAVPMVQPMMSPMGMMSQSGDESSANGSVYGSGDGSGMQRTNSQGQMMVGNQPMMLMMPMNNQQQMPMQQTQQPVPQNLQNQVSNAPKTAGQPPAPGQEDSRSSFSTN